MPLAMFDEKKGGPLGSIKHILAIAAGKGGVGKSTVTVNLAHALALSGFRVGVLDVDIYGPSIRKMLPEDRMPSQKGGAMLPALCRGIEMMSLAYFRQENQAAAIRAPIANGIVSQFIEQVKWGPLDFLLIDFPPGTGDVHMTICQKMKLTAALMVTTPQQVSVIDVQKAMDLFHQVNVPILGVLENMSYFQDGEKRYRPFGKGGGKGLAAEAGVPFLGEVPIDSEISACCDEGRTLFDSISSPSVALFKALALDVSTHVKALDKQLMSSLQSFELIWKEM